VADDPLRGDGPQPPLVPMNNAEVVDFDVIRGLDGAPPRRRWLVVGVVAIALMFVPLLAALYAGSGTRTHVTHVTDVHTPHQLLRMLCSELRSAEAGYTGGSITRHALEQRLAAIAGTTWAPDLDSDAAGQFLLDVGDQQTRLVDDGYFGGTSLDDAHHLCAG
jgi:hypothetical protein